MKCYVVSDSLIFGSLSTLLNVSMQTKFGLTAAERGASSTMSRSSRETFQDLELRLGPAYPSKGGMLAASCLRVCPDFVMIEDDEDYEQIYPAVSSGGVYAQHLIDLLLNDVYRIFFSCVLMFIYVCFPSDIEVFSLFQSMGTYNQRRGLRTSAWSWRCLNNLFFLNSRIMGAFFFFFEFVLFLTSKCSYCLQN